MKKFNIPFKIIVNKIVNEIERFEKLDDFNPKKYYSIETGDLRDKIDNTTIWKFDPRIKITDEYISNIDIAMGNNWERLCAQLGILAKEFRK